MITSLKNNRKALRSKSGHQAFKKGDPILNKQKLTFKSVSPEELKQVNQLFHERVRKQKMRNLSIFLILLVILFSAIYLLTI